MDWLKLVYVGIPLAFLVGVLRTSLQRATVGDLVVELSEVASPGQVRDALARTLGDPSLELTFWLPAKARYVDLNGQPFRLPEGDGRMARCWASSERRPKSGATVTFDASG